MKVQENKKTISGLCNRPVTAQTLIQFNHDAKTGTREIRIMLTLSTR
jgi:hypothetical protein